MVNRMSRVAQKNKISKAGKAESLPEQKVKPVKNRFTKGEEIVMSEEEIKREREDFLETFNFIYDY